MTTPARALCALLLLIAACGDGATRGGRAEESVAYSEIEAGAPAAAEPSPRGQAPPPPPVAPQGVTSTSLPAQGAAADTVVVPAMIIRTGTATVEVDSLDPAIARVRQLAERVGGYVANTSLQTGRHQVREASLELKVPAARFDQALGGLEPLGEVESVHVSAQDVGEEFVDVSARLANARRLEARLVELLERRTGSLEDVLAVERELARVREEIERHEGRLRYLRTRTAVSTLTVRLHEPYPVVGDYPGQNPVLGAFYQAWRNFVGFLAFLIASLGILVPLGIILWGVWWVVRRAWAGRRRPPRVPPPPAPAPPPVERVG